GGTSINGGTLSISADDNLGNAAGSLTFNGGTLQTTAAVASARAITLNAGGGTVDTAGQSDALSGVISGAGALTVADSVGGGVLTLSVANSYSGGTIVNGGTLQAGAAGAFGTGAITLSDTSAVAVNLNGFNQTIGGLSGGAAGGALNLGSAVLTVVPVGSLPAYAGTISGAGSLVINGSGSLTL